MLNVFTPINEEVRIDSSDSSAWGGSPLRLSEAPQCESRHLKRHAHRCIRSGSFPGLNSVGVWLVVRGQAFGADVGFVGANAAP